MRLLWPMRNDGKSWASSIFFVARFSFFRIGSYWKLAERKRQKGAKALLLSISNTQLGFVLRQTKFACSEHRHRQNDGRKLCDALAHTLCAQILIFADLLLDKAVAHLLHRNQVSNGGWNTNESTRSMEKRSHRFFLLDFLTAQKPTVFRLILKLLHAHTPLHGGPTEKRANILRAIFLMLGAQGWACERVCVCVISLWPQLDKLY